MLGALDCVQEGSNVSALRDEAAAVLAGLIQAGSISEWNDTQGRTQEQVVALVDKAIEVAQ